MDTKCATSKRTLSEEVLIPAGNVWLHGQLCVPPKAEGIVLFAHGSGSSRHSSRNQFVAGVLQKAGLGTLLFDLLTEDEEESDEETREWRFNIPLLSHRLTSTARWLQQLPETSAMRIGFFGASTGAAAALISAAELGPDVAAAVSRGGRVDLAGDALKNVRCPTLMIVGGEDDVVLSLNRDAYAQMPCHKELKTIPGATHLFEEPGTLEEVARLSAAWFQKHLCDATS